MDESLFYLIAFVCYVVVFGLVGAIIGERKGRPGAGFFWGAFLGPIGWLIVIAGPDFTGTKGRHCPYCNAVLEFGAVDCPNCKRPVKTTGAASDASWQKVRTADDDVAKWAMEHHLDAGDSAEPAAPASATPETKKCPFCAEVIKAEAIKCRYCGSDLRTAA